MVRRRSSLGILAAALFAVVFGTAQTPGPEFPELVAAADAANVVLSSPRVSEPNGSSRVEGQFHFVAAASFDVQALASLSPEMELIDEGQPNRADTKLVLARVPDTGLDLVLERVRALPGVIAVSKNWVARIAGEPNDYYWPTQKYVGAYLFNLDAAWEITHGRSSVRVAVIDTGVNGVPDLYPQLEPGLNFLESPPSEDVSDEFGHGTQVASIIAATHDNGASITGLAPRVRIVPVKACAILDCPDFFYSQALSWIFDQGNIDVINMSFSGEEEDATVKFYIDLITGELGGWGIVVAAAGNDGESHVEFPASHGPVVAVGGVNPDGSRHPDSNYGSDLDFAAPWTTVALGEFGNPEQFGGTSAAAPAVAGIAALYKSEYPIELQVQFAFMGVASFTNQSEWNNQTGMGVTDAWKMLWYGGCFRFDFNNDRRIDVSDAQAVAFRWGSFPQRLDYREKYDVNPFFYRDGSIDIRDIQRVFDRLHTTCKQ